MIEQSILVYKVFLVIKYSRVWFIFYLKIATPPEKSHPSLFQQPPLKTEALSRPPFLKIWWEVQSPPLSPPAEAERVWGEGRGVQTFSSKLLIMWCSDRSCSTFLFIFLLSNNYFQFFLEEFSKLLNFSFLTLKHLQCSQFNNKNYTRL